MHRLLRHLFLYGHVQQARVRRPSLNHPQPQSRWSVSRPWFLLLSGCSYWIFASLLSSDVAARFATDHDFTNQMGTALRARAQAKGSEVRTDDNPEPQPAMSFFKLGFARFLKAEKNDIDPRVKQHLRSIAEANHSQGARTVMNANKAAELLCSLADDLGFRIFDDLDIPEEKQVLLWLLTWGLWLLTGMFLVVEQT